MEFKDALKKLRRGLCMTQTELAEALHVNYATVSRWELGKTCPSRSLSAVLLEYAHSRSASADCLNDLKLSIVAATKEKLDVCTADEVFSALANMDYETIAVLDAETGEPRKISGEHLNDVIAEQTRLEDNVAGVEAYLRAHCVSDDVERVIKETSLPYVKERLKTQKTFAVAYSLRQKSGIVHKRTLYAYLDEKQSAILCAMQNITELYRMESMKREQIALALQTLQEQIGLNTARYDFATKSFYSNSDMVLSMGYGGVIKNVPEEFIEKGLIAPASVEEYRNFFDRLSTGEVDTITVACKVPDGSFHWVRIDSRLLCDRDNRPYQALMLFRDVDQEREQAAVYKKWRQSLERKNPGDYSLFRCNLNKDSTFDRAEGALLRARPDPALKSFNERALEYGGRFVHLDDFDAYTGLMNSEKLLAGYYRGVRSASLLYRERVTDEEYRWIRLTVELAQYPDSTDIEAFLMHELADPEEVSRLWGKLSSQQTKTARSCESVFENTGVVIVKFNWKNRKFAYDPTITRRISGRYDRRPLWEIFMTDQVADVQDVKVLKQMIYELAETPGRSSGAMELTLKTPSKGRHWFSVSAIRRADSQGATHSIILTLLDVNDDVLASRKLRFQAEHDSLTGLYNRAAFLKLVTSTILRKPADSYILLCCDINDFRFINERYGREEGDRLLQFSADKLRRYARTKDGFAGRLSNDVFAFLLPNAADLLERTKEAVQAFFKDYPLNVNITGRAGAYVVSDPLMKVDSMLDKAVIAKESIHGKFDAWLALYDDSMNEKRLREKSITERMESALADGQFQVYFQPQFHHATGQIAGAEALVRWVDPQRGIIPPAEFIPLFEKNGFITRMDEYVWDKAAQYDGALLTHGDALIPLSVNVSREDIKDPKLCAKLSAIVEKYSIPTHLFRLEITESLFAKDTERLVSVVKQLHEAGFLIEMDDFGSGYSSLNILKDVPVDILKLDMKFFSGSDNLGRGGVIINAVLRMSRWLGIPVIAEGVELKEQADFLLSVGCPMIQGYLYEKPLPAGDFEKMLQTCSHDKSIPHNRIDSELDVHSLWNPLSADSQVFNRCIGPAAVFEFHDNNYEILRMNERFAKILKIDASQMNLPSGSLSQVCEEDWPSFKKIALDAVYSSKDVTADIHCVIDGSRQTFHFTMRAIAKSVDRALIFVELRA